MRWGAQSIDPREMRSSPSFWSLLVTSITRSAESTASGFDGSTVDPVRRHGQGLPRRAV